MLANPLRLPCGASLPNRIAKSAMSEDLAGPGHLPDGALLALYSRWARSGAGLLVTGNVMVDRTALGEPHNVVIEPGAPVAPLAAWATAAQAGGAQVWPQLNHPGRQSPRFLSPVPVAPSAVALAIPGVFAVPRALIGPEILDIIDRFAAAARLCQQAGFDGVQVHGAHGYLVSQFLSPLANLREDEWGGDPERRRRFLIEVVRAIRAAVGPTFPIGVKLNSADFQRGGFDEAESMAVVEVLEAEGVDLLEISGGTYERPAVTGILEEQRASTVAREAYFLAYARRVRSRTRMPLMLTGGFRTAAGMAAAVEGGAVDVVGLARPMALQPELPRGILDGSIAESKVAPLRSGIKAADALLEIAWYSWQLKRMSLGKEPDPGVWPWAVLGHTAWDMLRAPGATWRAP